MQSLKKLPFFNQFTNKGIFNFGNQVNWPRPWKQFKNVSSEDLNNVHQMQNILRKNLPRIHQKGKYGLYHGKTHKTGKQTCFSEKKTIRWWKVNVQKKSFMSEILNRRINMPVSTAAIKNIRLYGGFDNYIMLCKSNQMYSTYGEYLRKIMINKINNPEWKTPYILKSATLKKKTSKKQLKFRGKSGIWHPPDQRYIDLSHLRMKQTHELNRKELADLRELEELEKKQEDISTNHPLIKQIQDQTKKEMSILEPDRQKAMEVLGQVKEKKYLAQILKYVQEGQKEFQNPPNLKK